MESLQEAIAKHPFWKGLNPCDIRLVQECAISERFEAGQLIFQEGQEADRFCLIQTGQVRLDAFVPRRGIVTVQTLTAGAALGWSWLFPPYRWHFSAHANETTELTIATVIISEVSTGTDRGVDLALLVLEES